MTQWKKSLCLYFTKIQEQGIDHLFIFKFIDKFKFINKKKFVFVSFLKNKLKAKNNYFAKVGKIFIYLDPEWFYGNYNN